MDYPSPEYCCPNCFAYPTLLSIIEDESRDEGQCDFCGSEAVPLIHVSALYEAFHNAVRIYHPADSGSTVAPWEDAWDQGEPLYQALDGGCHVFSELLSGTEEAARLLQAILESGWDDDSGEPFPDACELVVARRSWVHQTPAESWRDFSYAILHDESLDHYIPESVDEDIHILKRKLSKDTLFRAQRGFATDQFGRKVPYTGKRIGAPPPEKAKPGRANKQCEVVFYAAEQRETAVAEVRPARGLLVSVGEFEINRPTNILDLLHKPARVDPFVDEGFEYWIDFWSLMQEFAQSLSKPLERDDRPEIDYRPTQRLTKWFRNRGFDGIRYPSALHENGVNIVLFDPRQVTFRESSLVKVDDVEWSFSPYREEEE